MVSETMKMVMDDKAIEAIVSMLMDLQDRENVNLPLYEQQLREADTAIIVKSRRFKSSSREGVKVTVSGCRPSV